MTLGVLTPIMGCMNTFVNHTLCTRIARKLTHNLLAALILAAIGMGAVANQESVYAARPDVTTSTAALIAAHDCWTGEAPADMAGTIPGHVVVSVDGVARYAGERMVGRALEQVFDGVDHGLAIHGFCR